MATKKPGQKTTETDETEAQPGNKITIQPKAKIAVRPSDAQAEPVEVERESGGNFMHLRELKEKKINDLVDMGKELGIENAGGMRKQDLIFGILQKKAEKDEHIFAD